MFISLTIPSVALLYSFRNIGTVSTYLVHHFSDTKARYPAFWSRNVMLINICILQTPTSYSLYILFLKSQQKEVRWQMGSGKCFQKHPNIQRTFPARKQLESGCLENQSQEKNMGVSKKNMWLESAQQNWVIQKTITFFFFFNDVKKQTIT